MPFSADELANIANASLDFYMDQGKVFAQNIQNKPMLAAFNEAAKEFTGGKGAISIAVKSGQGGGTLSGYEHDDQVSYYNPTGIKRVEWDWKEHHIGITFTHSELKHDGVNVIENGAVQRNVEIDGREKHVLANILDDKNEVLAEDYAYSLDRLLHADGSVDVKALAGIQAFILDDPDVGSTGGLSRVVNSWWRNRAATTASGGAIASNTADGGALISFLDKEWRQLRRYAGSKWTPKVFAGSDFIEAYKKELRANGTYSMTMSTPSGRPDGSMKDPKHDGFEFVYDPTLDDINRSKYCYVIDMSAIRLVYLAGNKMKRASPARPYDRYTQFLGITMTGCLVTNRLNTSAVYAIQ